MLAMTLGTASGAHAERLLAPRAAVRTPGGAGELPHVARVQSLTLGRTALRGLRAQTHALVAGFPLGVDGAGDLVLARVEPFAPGARVEVMVGGTAQALALPDQVYFGGTVAGEPDSRAFLVAGPDAVHGFVVRGGTVYQFGPDGAGLHRSYALRDADPRAYPPPGDFCGNDLHPETSDTPGVHAETLRREGLLAPPIAPAVGPLKQADVAIETDNELWAKFGSNQATLTYLASLAAAANVIYERDLNLRLRFSYIRLWASSTTDPWTGTSTSSALSETRTYWTNPANNMDAIAGSRDLVHVVSGKSVQGGIAYVGALCNAGYGFGVSQVFGSFNVAVPSQIWDLMVVAHEIGHNVGSPHTHCYSPVVDQCYNGESSCYSGTVVASRGTIMSYCHLLAGGLSNIDLLFGSAVSARIGQTLSAATCLANVGNCGNGAVDTGEQCDDGNTAAGDGCSSSCRIEACGNAVVDAGETCDDGNTTAGDGCSAACQREVRCGNGVVETGETCDDGNTTAGDGCSATCQREPRCGSGVVDTGETCDDGNTTAGDGCSATCQREPRCGDGRLDPGEQCDDGNTTSGDGCSATCVREACVARRQQQTLWEVSRVTLRRGIMTLHGDFGIPVAVDQLAPEVEGLRLLVENAAGEAKLDVTLPGGEGWVAHRGGWLYRDARGKMAGIRKLSIRDRTQGGLAEVEIHLTGRGRSYGIGAGDLPLALTVVLGDFQAGQAGACGRHGFKGHDCFSGRGGRVECR